MGLTKDSTPTKPGWKDRAETFSESDVTITTTAGYGSTSGGHLGIQGDSPGPFSENSKSTGETLKHGCYFTPNEPIDELWATRFTNTTAGTAYVETSGGSTIASSSFDANDECSFTSLGLSAGTQYRLVANSSGNSFDASFDSDVSFPISGDMMDIDNGLFDDGSTSSYLWCFSNIREAPMSATVTVEWPKPADVYRWDSALFQRVTDGETLNIYIEENQSGSWTEIAGPIKRGDEIPADPSNNTRFRIELSRNNKANDPRVESIYRRWVV